MARRVARVVAWVTLSALLLVLMVALTLTLWARSPSGRRVILARVVSMMQQRLDGRLTIGALEGDLTRHVVLRDLRVYDRERQLAVAVAEIRGEYDLRALFSRRVHVRSLAVDGARVHGRYLRDGRINLATLGKQRRQQQRGSGAGRDWEVAIDTLGGTADILVDGRSERTRLRGQLAVDGRASIVGDRYDVEVSRFGLVTEAPLRATIDGAGGGRWERAAQELRELRVHLRTDGREVDLSGALEATLRARGSRDGLDAELVVTPEEGQLRVRAHAAMPPGGELTWRAMAEAHDLDPGALSPWAPHGLVELAAGGRGSAHAGTIDLERLTLDAAGTHALAYGSVALGPELAADLRAEMRGAHGVLDAHARVRRSESHTEVDAELTAHRLRLGATRVGGLAARVHARDLEGYARLDVHDLDVAAARRLPALHLKSLALAASGDTAHVALDLHASDPHGVVAELRAHGVPLPDEGRWAVDVALDRLVVAARGQHWQATAPGRLRVDRRSIHAALALAADEQRLLLDGSLARDSGRFDVTLHGRQLVIEQLRPLLPRSLQSLAGRAGVSAHAAGTTRDPELTAELALPDWSLGALAGNRAALELSYRHGRLEARADAQLAGGDAGTLSVELDVDRRTPAAPITLVARGHALDLSRLPLAAFGVGTPIHDGVVELSADVHGTLRAPAVAVHVEGRALAAGAVDDLAVDFDGAYEHGGASATMSASIGGGAVLTARADSPLDLPALVAGRRWQDAPLTVDATIPSFDLAHVRDLGGTLEGRAEVRGTLAHPTAHAELHARELQLSELRAATLDARADWDGQALTATVDSDARAQGALHLDARLPADPSAPVHATFRAQAFTLAVDNVGRLRRLEGTLNADLELAGSRAQPTLGGYLKIDHGAFAGGNDPRLFHDLTVDVAARPGTVELRRLAVKAGSGSLGAHGSLGLDGLHPTAVELVVDADKFPFHATHVGAWVDAHAELHGKRVGDTLQGSVTISDGRAELPTLDAGRQLQSTAALADVVYVDEAAQRQREASERRKQKAAAVAAHVVAHIPGPFRIRSKEMSADLSGELEVRLANGVPRIYGHAETASGGRIDLLGRRYDVDRARVSFDGTTDPVLDVRLTREVSNAVVAIEVHGTAKAPVVELTSDPPVYDSSQLIGIIVSGDPANQRLDPASIDQRIVGAVSGVLVDRIRDQIAPGLPIDVIKIETGADSFGGFGSARFEVGKYIRENIYVSYTHQLGASMSGLRRVNAHEVNIEYRFRRHYVTSISYGDAGVGTLDLSWTLRF